MERLYNLANLCYNPIIMNIIFGENLGVEKWDAFVQANAFDFGLLQSWAWGEFQKSLGRPIFRLVVADDRGEIKAVAQIIQMPLKLGKSYFYLPRLIMTNNEIVDFLLTEIKNLAKKEKAIFLRLEPAAEMDTPTPSDSAGRNRLPLRQGEKIRFIGQVQPKKTLILDLTKSEAELLAQMKSKTRYNIKVAEKHGIEIAIGPEYFEDFWRLTGKTSERQEIKPHAKNYYEKMLTTLGEAGMMKLYVAKSEGQVIAANLMVFFGQWCVYLHGASDYQFRDKMAPFLLQWRAILDAKVAGCTRYDFWGADETKWPGVTRFKTGFAPAIPLTEYPGAYDVVYEKFWYNIYRLVKKF